jgi:hypothetical protein
VNPPLTGGFLWLGVLPVSGGFTGVDLFAIDSSR